MKKILLIENDIWSLYNFRIGLINRLISEGYEVHLAGYDNSDERINELNVRVHHLNIESSSKNPFKDLLLIKQMVELYKRIGPTMIFLYSIKPNIYGNFAAKITKDKTVSNVNGLGNIFMEKSKTRMIVEILYKIAFKIPQKVFFQNKDDMKLFTSSNLIAQKKAERIPGSGVNVEKFKPVKYLNNKEVTFLLIARMIWSKGIKEYIEVAKLIKSKGYSNVKFQLLGPIGVDNPEAVPQKVIEKNVKDGLIEYLGVSKDVRNEIKNSHCIVLPSFYREGVPKTLIESASMGKPIITTDNVGCRDIVENGYNGFLCESKSVKSLFEKIEKFLKLSEKEKNTLGINGRIKVEKEFDEEIIIKKYLKEILKK